MMKFGTAPVEIWNNRPDDPQKPTLQYFPVSTAAPCGCILVCPGGGYANLADHEGEPIARKFNALGYHAFILRYHLMPAHFPEPQRDILRSIRLIRSKSAELGIQENQIAVLGFSAGGHLAGSAEVFHDKVDSSNGDEADSFSARPDAAILCYPVTTFLGSQPLIGCGNCFMGKDFSEEQAAEVNLLTHVTPHTPPTFLWHSREDDAVPIECSLKYAMALQENHVVYSLHVFPRGRHGTGLSENFEDMRLWPELASDFLHDSCGFTKSRN